MAAKSNHSNELFPEVQTGVVNKLFATDLDVLYDKSKSSASRDLINSLQAFKNSNSENKFSDAWKVIQGYLDNPKNKHRTLYKLIKNKIRIEQTRGAPIARPVPQPILDSDINERNEFIDKLIKRRGYILYYCTRLETALVSSFIHQKNYEEIAKIIEGSSCITRNALLDEVSTHRYEQALNYFSQGKYDIAIAKLTQSIRHHAEAKRYELLAKCHLAKDEKSVAHSSYMLAISQPKEYELQHNKKYYLERRKGYIKEANKLMADILRSDPEYVKGLATANTRKYCAATVDKAFKRVIFGGLADGSQKDGLVWLNGVFTPFVGGLNYIIPMLTGTAMGIFKAATRNPLSIPKQKTLIEGLARLMNQTSPAEQEELIGRVVEAYEAKRSKLTSSNPSRDLLLKLKNKHTTPDAKIAALANYMLQMDEYKLFHNNGKKLFSIIAEECAKIPAPSSSPL